MSTPHILGIARGTCVPPPGGWKNQTYYVIDISWSSSNPAYRAILYVGFVPSSKECAGSRSRFPQLAGGYTSIMQDEGSTRDNGIMSIQDAYYIKAIAAIPGIGALDKQHEPFRWLG